MSIRDFSDISVHCAVFHHWCGGSSTGLLHKLWKDPLLLLGHCWAREVWRSSRWSLHSWAMCNYNLETLLYLARKLAGHEAELVATAAQPLPDDDDEAFE
ncbi:hypothetical protein ACFX12_041280 [Malus domestica]